MDVSELYETDFLAWTEQQAAALRSAAGVSNNLDLPHLAEEVESLGRRDLRDVESLIRQILLHLLKIVAEPASEACRHWRIEVVGFQADASRAFSPSMGQRVDVDRIWQQVLGAFSSEYVQVFAQSTALPRSPCPLRLDELINPLFDVWAAVGRVAAATASPTER